MSNIEFAQEMLSIATKTDELTYENDFNKEGASVYNGNYCKKWYLKDIISRSYDAAKNSISSFIEQNDIRKLNDEDYKSFNKLMIEILNK